MAGTALAIRGLTKNYAGRPVLDRVDLTLAAGCVHGLLGPNGAGKSTLLRACLGLVRPDEGEIRLLGRAPDAGLAGVAAALEAPRWWPRLDGVGTLRQLATLDDPRTDDEIDPVLAAVGLTGVTGTVAGWSVGQRQRLALAAALIRRPRLLLLDEPTSGLDPAGTLQIQQLLRRLADDGVAVLLSSHDLAEVGGLCDEVTVLREGTVVAAGPIARLREAAPLPVHRISTTDDPCARQLAGPLLLAGGPELRLRGSLEQVDELALTLAADGVVLRTRAVERPALDELYLGLTEGGTAPLPLPPAEPLGPPPAGARVPRRATVAGVAAVCRPETLRLLRQWPTRVALLVCLLGPFVFALALRAQDALPVDTVFGRELHTSGFATPLVVLGFAGTWALPLLTGLVAGDVFSAEDTAGTWPLLLTRSRSRGEVLAGKLVAAAGVTVLLFVVLAAASLLAGIAATGVQPLLGLGGSLLGAGSATGLVVASFAAVLPPVLAFAALAALLSLAGRRSWVGVVGPVVIGVVMVLIALLSAAHALRPLLLTVPFESWHGLFEQPRSVTAVLDGLATSAVWLVASVAATVVLLRRRDVR